MTKQYKITVNGKTYDVSVEEIRPVASNKTVSTIVNTPVNTPKPSTIVNTPVNTPKPAAAPAPKPAAAPATPIDENAISVKATMPGTIVSFSVAVGDKVQEGQVVAILEAMKMENEITAPASGEVQVK